MATLRRELVFPQVAPVMFAVLATWALAVGLLTFGNLHAYTHGDVLGNRTVSWPVALILFLLTWQVMTAAMMLPTTIPMIGLFAKASRNQSRPQLALGVFLAAYFAVWTGFAVVALAGDSWLHWLVDQTPWLGNHEFVIPGTVLLFAGAFQFSSLKEKCLDACRSPLNFLFRFYRRGTHGAWTLGVRHGLFCLGCCWALMLLMFAVGVGSLAWMAVLTGVMTIEKTSRYGNRLAPVVGVVLLLFGAVVLSSRIGYPRPSSATTTSTAIMHLPVPLTSKPSPIPPTTIRLSTRTTIEFPHPQPLSGTVRERGAASSSS
jgi:predicted metal-binding membrane protein